ncbi:cyclase family protein [Clostridioides difficile]|uniref:cyclase family protein n=1 Tax=Clostridioides difficile TaxID=1496 RepID=UPI001F18891A|nr:cyclase family protein [Clostridioides difficile]
MKYRIRISKKYEDENKNSDFIILNQVGQILDKKQYYVGYPTLTKEAANYIANTNIKGIGIRYAISG